MRRRQSEGRPPDPRKEKVDEEDYQESLRRNALLNMAFGRQEFFGFERRHDAEPNERKGTSLRRREP